MGNHITQEQIDNFWTNPGITNHEFSDKVVKDCKPIIDGIAYRILSGESTLEQEEEKLLAQWEKLLASKSD